MRNFGKHLGTCLLWLLLSEILCLILAFSFAILTAKWIRWLSLICGIAAHLLLMGSVGGKLAHEDIADYRMDHSAVSPIKPLLLGVCTAVPLWILWFILKVMQDSNAALNFFLLLNAPYIQYHRLILAGAEPFSAVSAGKQLLMALPPVLTAGAVFIGYRLRYLPEKAALDAQNMH